MAEIDIQKEREKYTNQLNAFIAELERLEKQRATLLQAMAERQGILAFLNSLNEHKEDKLSS